jgi:ribosomal protein S6
MGLMQETELETNGLAQETDGRVYELGYLLVPTISEEEAPAAFGNLKDLVTTLGGASISEEMPKMIPLAYVMNKVIQNVRHKFDRGYFGWIKFTMDSDKVLELKKKLDLDPTLIRFILLKTVKENTLASKRFIRPDAHKKPKAQKEGEVETAAPINKEEIDKEIDAMVAA